MRRRRRTSRLAGLAIGAAFSGGLFFLDWTAIPKSQPQLPRLETEATQIRFDSAPPENAKIAVTSVSETPKLSPLPPAATVEARPGDTPLKLLARVGVAPRMRRKRRACLRASGIRAICGRASGRRC
jgi:hypothetical protein